MKKNALTIVTAGLLLLALMLYWCSFTVSAGHVVVVKSLGAISRVESQPGLYFKMPWPFQSIHSLDTRTQVLTIPGNEVLTKDKLNVIMSVAAGWRVKSDPESVKQFYQAMEGSPANAAEKFASRVRAIRKKIINKTPLPELVNAKPEQRSKFQAFEQAIRDEVQASLDSANYGLEVTFLSIQSIKFPKTVIERIFERMTKERQRASEKYLVEGETRARIIRNTAQSDAEKMLADAEAEAIRIRGRANAQAAEAYKDLQKHAELANWLSRLELWRRVFTNGPRKTLVLPNQNSFENLIPKPPTTLLKNDSKSAGQDSKKSMEANNDK